MSNDRIQREKDFHDNLFGDENEDRSGSEKYYVIMDSAESAYGSMIEQSCRGKRLLEFGCGVGNDSVKWLGMGAILTGIDISEEGVRVAREQIEKTDFTASFYAMNAEATEFKDKSFDMVIGTAIIHHLDILKSYEEIARLLDVGGRAIFLEPLGHNPLINLYRRLTPSLRTADEHPLLHKDILLAEKYFEKVSGKYYYLFALFAVPFSNMFFFKGLLRFLEGMDNAVMRLLPFLRKYAWYMILDLQNPKK